MPTPVSNEVARNAPLTFGAFYLSFISQYGVVVVTTLALVFGIMQIVFRIREHRAIMRYNAKE